MSGSGRALIEHLGLQLNSYGLDGARKAPTDTHGPGGTHGKPNKYLGSRISGLGTDSSLGIPDELGFPMLQMVT